MFDELARAGRVLERRLPDGSSFLCCETYGRAAGIDGTAGTERTVPVIASDGSENRYGDVDDPAGWKFDHFNKNPVVLLDHNYSVEAIVGVALRSWLDGDRFLQVHQFDPPESNRASQMILAKIRAGSARAVSVSFLPLKSEKIRDGSGNWTGGFVFREMELLETSWVAIPANRNAVRLATDAPARSALAASKSNVDLPYLTSLNDKLSAALVLDRLTTIEEASRV
jgi:hypothetical protein